jgi:hypothetical protein
MLSLTPAAQTKSMPRGVRRRISFESASAAVVGGCAILTAIWPDWIETLFGVDPDNHSGAVEWGVVLVLAIMAAVLSAFARIDGSVTRRSGRRGPVRHAAHRADWLDPRGRLSFSLWRGFWGSVCGWPIDPGRWRQRRGPTLASRPDVPPLPCWLRDSISSRRMDYVTRL